MTMDTQTMQTLFPAAGPTSKAAPYCLGYVLCRLAGDEDPYVFPRVQTMGNALRRLNPTLSEHEARWHARAIARHNEADRMAQAWTRVARALKPRRRAMAWQWVVRTFRRWHQHGAE
jgi:hypothetical protein